MYFAVLGPLEVHDGERLCTPTRTKLRDLLALLLVSVGRQVSRRSLIADLWDHCPPPTAAPALHVYVSQLRQLLSPGLALDAENQLLQTVPDGYRITVGPEECDLSQFERMSDQGIAAMESGDAELAATVLRRALWLWRGPAFADIALPAIQDFHVPRLEELRLTVLGRRIDADLTLGRHEEVLPELAKLVAENPLNEDFAARLIRAWMAGGRPDEALATYRQLSTRLREDLGLEPGTELQTLCRAVLAGRAPSTDQITTVRVSWQSPAQLPRDLPDFTGRGRLVEEIGDALLHGANQEIPTPCLITGPAGVGKTSLAVHVAHVLKDHFPDGQLFVDLQGFEYEPREPASILSDLLADIGVDRRSIPQDIRQRSELFRAHLRGRRVLLLLDNAGSPEQLSPFLPSGLGCMVLVTSRNTFSQWTDVVRVSIDALNADESIELLAAILGGDRVARESHAARQIVDACGRLPLAVRIAAARLGVREYGSLEQFANRLDDEKTRLDELVAGDLEMRASIALTYRSCAEADRKTLRALGVLPDCAFPSWLAAALTGTSTETAQRIIDHLVQVHLLRVAGRDTVGQLSYGFHELVRIFARDQFGPEKTAEWRVTTLERVAEGYLALLDRVEAHGCPAGRPRLPRPALTWKPGEHGVVEIVDTEPLAWLEMETDRLIHLIITTYEFGLDGHAIALADRLLWFLAMKDNRLAWSSVLSVGLAAARRLGDPQAEAALLRSRGDLTEEQLIIDRRYVDQVMALYQ